MDSLKVASISFANYGIHLANINLFLQLIVAVMTIVYLANKIRWQRRNDNAGENDSRRNVFRRSKR